MKNIIFHIPINLRSDYISGTMIRPKFMLEAFKELGYKVYIVSGPPNERYRIIKLLKHLIESGYKFEFLYSESINFPTTLLNIRYGLKYMFVDLDFFIYLKKNKIPIGLFYRDIYWRFDQYKKEVRFLKRLAIIPFFIFELFFYKYFVSVLFLPTEKLAEYIPGFLRPKRICSLPPGCKSSENIDYAYINKNYKTILYVGNIKPPEHDIELIFLISEYLEKNKCINLLICCPKETWLEWRDYYLSSLNGKIPKNVTIIHKSWPEVSELYRDSDLFILPIRDVYSRNAVHIKLFEAIGYGLPIVVCQKGNSEAGKIVLMERIGWVTNYDKKSLIEVLKCIFTNEEEYNRIRENVKKIRHKHLWGERAKTVASIIASANKI